MNKYFGKFLAMTFGIMLVICLIIFPEKSLSAATNGIRLWFNTVFPALFPFFVGVEILNKSGFVRLLGVIMEPITRPLFKIPGCGAFTMAVGITSGYPMGAKVTSELRKNNDITKIEAERMLAYCNNSGPLFIVGAVGVGMFSSPKLGLILLMTHIFACLTVAFIFRFYGNFESKYRNQTNGIKNSFTNEFAKDTDYKDFGSLLGNAIKNAMSTIIAIGGFIIFFSVIINLLSIKAIPMISELIYSIPPCKGIAKELINSILCGGVEITTGTNLVSKISDTSITTKACTAAFLLGWAGLSVHAQVSSIISDTDISIKPYLIGKALHSVIAAFYTYLMIWKDESLYLPVFLTQDFNERFSNYWDGIYFNGYVSKYYLTSIVFLVLCIIYSIFAPHKYLSNLNK